MRSSLRSEDVLAKYIVKARLRRQALLSQGLLDKSKKDTWHPYRVQNRPTRRQLKGGQPKSHCLTTH
jgi:hypothetical protein